jgi:hypothetical protein
MQVPRCASTFRRAFNESTHAEPSEHSYHQSGPKGFYLLSTFSKLSSFSGFFSSKINKEVARFHFCVKNKTRIIATNKTYPQRHGLDMLGPLNE